ncbi:class I SAM-dependent methyltransferase [Patescibacteria group bacterium]|nr:class I SAM-dependent methyltransferase [Patescibacteria group bacterium]
MKCLNCQSTSQKILFSNCIDWEYNKGDQYNVFKCSDCGLIYLYPIPTIKELLSFYPSNYHGYKESSSKLTNFLINLNIKNRVRLYRKLIGKEGRVLEIGVADGSHFLLLKKYEDWDLWGIEFNNDIAERGRKKGLNIITGILEEYDFSNTKFDLIIINNLIEHVIDPVETLEKAKKILKSNGLVVGETPNTHSLDFYIFGKYWGGLHIPRHTFLFNQYNLKSLGNSVGFLVEINQKIDTNHWAGSLQNFFQSKRFLKTELKNGRTWYYPFLLLFFIPLNFFQKIFGLAGVIRFKMRKRN